MSDVKVKKEIIIKRVSAFKFEIQVSDNDSIPEKSPQVSVKTPNQLNSEAKPEQVQRISVIRKAPPSNPKNSSEKSSEKPDVQTVRTNDAQVVPAGAILIKDAIMYRIVEILLWKLLGENRLKLCGYPTAPTYQVLWRVIYFSCFEPGARKPAVVPLAQDHDCRGNIVCFMDHVSRLLEICAPTRDLWKKFGWARLSVEDILKKIYYEDLVPYLRRMDKVCDPNILHCQADIVLLEKWKEQGFTAISWNGQRHFSQIKSENDKCPQCNNEPGVTRENTLWHNIPSKNKTDGGTEPSENNCKGHAQNYFCAACVMNEKEDERMASKPETSNGIGSNRSVKKRGRPSYKNNNKSLSKKSKRVLLWKFIYNLVEDPETDDYIRWVNRNEGVFQIINSEWLARTWGRNHGNPKMTYEKMARAMRTYYRSKVLQSVPRSYDYPRKLIYRFNPEVIVKLQAQNLESGKKQLKQT